MRQGQWRIGINGQGVEITNGVRRLVEGDLRAVLEPHNGRVASAHVRLWEPVDGEGPTTCYIRVELRPSGGLALGSTAPDLARAVKQASKRVGDAVHSRLSRHGTTDAAGSYSWFRS